MLRNWSKWSISFRSKFFEIDFDQFRFDPVKISINFDRFSLRNWYRNFVNDRNFSKKFRKISIVRSTIEIDRNKFRKISIVGSTIEIDRNLFRKISITKKSKFFETFWKNFEMVHFVSNFVSFRFENPSKFTPDRNFATSWFKWSNKGLLL